MARKRIDPESVAVFHLGLRFPDRMRDDLFACVDAANERARTQGLPANVTASSLVRVWIEQRLAEELARLGKKKRT